MELLYSSLIRINLGAMHDLFVVLTVTNKCSLKLKSIVILMYACRARTNLVSETKAINSFTMYSEYFIISSSRGDE